MFVVFALLCLAGCGATMPTKPAGKTEFLKVEPYPATPAWKKITDKGNADGSIMEWIPADQNESDIKDIMTVQVFYNLKDNDPDHFLNGMLGLLTKTCAQVRHSGKSHADQEPPYSYMQVFCSFPNGKHEEVDMFLKAIEGKDGFYLVQREFHYPKEEGPAGVNSFSKDQVSVMVGRLNQMSTTSKYLDDQVYLCPTAGGGLAGCGNGSVNVAIASSTGG
jgi:hypothetical protein